MSALVLALAVAIGTSAAPADDSWITIDRDVLIAFETGVEPALAPASSALSDPLGIRPDVIAVPMTEERMVDLAQFIHERYRRCGGFVAHGGREEAYASAFRSAAAAEMEEALPPVPYTIDNGAVANALANAIQELQIRTTISDLSNNFFTRYHGCPSGQQSAQYIKDKWQGYATAAGRADVTVEFFSHVGAPSPTNQPSVILTIPGTTTPSENVVLGGHQDSIAGSNCSTSRSPGADDDASGIATLTEMIRVAMQLGYRPAKTVRFMAYAAEEVGLRGSNHIAGVYQSTGVNVIGVLQFDMTNYSDTPADDIVIFTDFTTAGQNAFLQQLVTIYFTGVSGNAYKPRPTSQCGYGCSDHAAWFNRGYVASFPFEARFNDHSPFIHTSNDTLAQSGGHANRSVPFAKLGAVYMAELAKGSLVPLAPAAPKADAKPRARVARRDAARPIAVASTVPHTSNPGRRGGRKDRTPMRSLAGAAAAAALALVASTAHAAPTPCVGGMAGIYACNKVDMMVQMPLSAIGGGSGNDVWGWTDSTTGKEYAIIGLSNGTSFVDISDPAAPLFLGRLPAPPTGACVPTVAPAPLAKTFEPMTQVAPDHDECQSPYPDDALLPYVGLAPDHCGSDSQWRDHETINDHVYIGSEQGGHGLVVFNLATLRNVANPPVIFAQTARYCGFGNSHTITVNPQRNVRVRQRHRHRQRLRRQGVPVIVNVATPGAPTFAGCDNAGIIPNPYTHDSQCLDYNGPDVAHQGKAICIKSNGSGTNANNRLVISDVTNPAAPVLLSSTGYAGAGYTHQGWITHDHAYFLLDDELDESDFRHNTRTYIWNFTDLDAPVLMGFHQHATPAIDHQQFVHNNFTYQSNYRAGLRILETQNVASRPALRGRRSSTSIRPTTTAAFNGTWANYPFFRSGIVAVSTIESASPGGFFLLRPTFADLAVTVTDAPDPVPVGQNGDLHLHGDEQRARRGPRTRPSPTRCRRRCPGVRHAVAGQLHGDDDRRLQPGHAPERRRRDGGHRGHRHRRRARSRTPASGSAAETDTRLADNTATAQTTVTQSAQAAEPSGLVVDAAGNRVFQPNEGAVIVAPSWRNIGTAAIQLSGAAAGFTGPAGPTYTTVDGVGAYPSLAPGASAQCTDCYSFSIAAAARPATHWDSTFLETVNPSATAKTWTLHVGNSFGDVPPTSPFFRFVETMLHRGVTGGCTTSAFCPGSSTTREQMAVFALVSKEGASYVPPAVRRRLRDVHRPAGLEPVLPLGRGAGPARRGRRLRRRAATARRCRWSATRCRSSRCKTLEGAAYTPPACGTPMYVDVPASSPFCRWIEELTRRGVVSGCGGGNYCPAISVSREQMSVFLTVTFGLTLYGL